MFGSMGNFHQFFFIQFNDDTFSRFLRECDMIFKFLSVPFSARPQPKSGSTQLSRVRHPGPSILMGH